MSTDIRTQQSRLIAGVAILALLLILVIIALFRSIQKPAVHSQIGHRSPAAELAYCSPGSTELCIISFGQVEGGDMLVNFQLPSFFYPEFMLAIDRFGVQSTYECKKVKSLSKGVVCTGASQAPGEVLGVKVISTSDGSLLAEGKFAIIGIAIATPEDLLTAILTSTAVTETATETPISTPSPSLPTPTGPTPAGRTPTPSPVTPSYPNPYP